jgi:hypothetical protein
MGSSRQKSARGELDADTKTRNALLRSVRYKGKRGFALVSQRWRALQRAMVSPTAIGDIARLLMKYRQAHKYTAPQRPLFGKRVCRSPVGAISRAELRAPAYSGCAALLPGSVPGGERAGQLARDGTACTFLSKRGGRRW